MTNAKDLTVVITHRCADRYRDRNLEVVLKHLRALNCTQTLVVEQDAHRRLPDSGTLDESVEHVFAFNPGGFNRSWGFNIGANLARGKTILFLDGDLIVPRWALEAALDACENGADAVNPYSRLVELSLKHGAKP